LLDAERVTKQNAIAKMKAELSAVRQRAAEQTAMADAQIAELKEQLKNKERIYDDMVSHNGKKFGGLQGQFDGKEQQLAQKEREYITLCQEHESVASQILVLKNDNEVLRQQHAAALEEHAATVAQLQTTIEDHTEHHRKKLADTVAEHEAAANTMRNDHLTVQRDLQSKHAVQVNEIVSGKDGAYNKAVAAFDQSQKQLLLQYEQRVGALEEEVDKCKADIEKLTAAAARDKREAAEQLAAAVTRERNLQVQLTDEKHKTNRLQVDLEAANVRINTTISDAEKMETALHNTLAERDIQVEDLKSEVVATRNKLPPLVAAHEAKEAAWTAEMNALKIAHVKEVAELESEMEGLAQQLEDTTRKYWNEVQEKKIVTERLESTILEGRATVQRMEQEKADALAELQALLYANRQEHSGTQNQLAETRRQLQDAIDDGDTREETALEQLKLQERGSSRTCAKLGRDISYINSEKDESLSVAAAAKNESERLRKDLRVLLAHNAKVERNSKELVNTVDELQDSLENQAELMETEARIMSLKLKEEVDTVCLEASESIRMANERVDRAETREEITHTQLNMMKQDSEQLRRSLREA